MMRILETGGGLNRRFHSSPWGNVQLHMYFIMYLFYCYYYLTKFSV